MTNKNRVRKKLDDFLGPWIPSLRRPFKAPLQHVLFSVCLCLVEINTVALFQGLPGLRGEKGDSGERGEKVDVELDVLRRF